MSKFTGADGDEFEVYKGEDHVLLMVNGRDAVGFILTDVPAISHMLMQAYYEGKHIDSN